MREGCVQTMSHIESEARAQLIVRRDALRRARAGNDWVPGVFSPDDEVHTGSLAEKVARELAEVDAALGRLDAGQYGRCDSCGGPLGLQRLRAIPEARYCLGCSGHRPGDD